MKFSRYLVFNFLKMFLLVLLGAVLMFIVIDFVGNIRTWLARDLADAREYYIAYLPYIVYLVTPVALFIGVVASVGNMSRHLEMMAIQESGRSPFCALVPIFFVGAAVTAFSFYLDAKVLPDSNHKRYKIMEPAAQQRRDPRITDKRDFVYISGDRTSWFMRMYAGASKTGREPVILIYRDGNLYERFDAKRLRWIEPDTALSDPALPPPAERRRAPRRKEGSLVSEKAMEKTGAPARAVGKKSPGFSYAVVLDSGYWRLEDGFDRVFLKDGFVRIRHFVKESLKGKTALRPEDFLDDRQRGDEMDAKTILRKIEIQKRSGEKTSVLETAYYFKFSGSVMNFVVLLIGAALAHRFNRNGGLSQKFGVGILLVFSYYIVIRIGLKMGENGVLSPMLAAWIGHAVFGVLAILMLHRSFRL